MTKQCKYILAGLQKLTDNTDAVFGYYQNLEAFCLPFDAEKQFSYALYADEIKSIMHDLIMEGFIFPSETVNGFRLTQKGLHPVQSAFAWIANNLLLPVAVALITTLATLWTNGLLPR